jgi:hypothetical protein
VEHVAINLDAMFPDMEHREMRYVLHVCGLRDIPSSQTRPIEFEGIENVKDLANYTDNELDAMADRNSKCTPTAMHDVQMGLQTKTLKAITHWVRKKNREGALCDLQEPNQTLNSELIMEINSSAGKRDADSKLHYPDPFSTTDYQKLDQELDQESGGLP